MCVLECGIWRLQKYIYIFFMWILIVYIFKKVIFRKHKFKALCPFPWHTEKTGTNKQTTWQRKRLLSSEHSAWAQGTQSGVWVQSLLPPGPEQWGGRALPQYWSHLCQVSDVASDGWPQFDSLLTSAFLSYPIALPKCIESCPATRLVLLLPRLYLEEGCSMGHGIRERNVSFNKKLVTQGL